MKVLGIVCSPRKGGNTEIMMNEALAGARSNGAEIELWSTAGKILSPCDGCQSCLKEKGKCHIDDDIQDLYPKILAADGIIFGSPSYFGSVSAQAKIVIDRLYGLYNMYLLPGKVAAVVSVAIARGHEGIWSQFRNLFERCHMLVADHAYGFAKDIGDIRKDTHAMIRAKELGKEVASLISQQFRWPEEYRKPFSHVCRERYKTVGDRH